MKANLISVLAIFMLAAANVGTVFAGLSSTWPDSRYHQYRSDTLPPGIPAPGAIGGLTAQECVKKRGVILHPGQCQSGKDLGYVRDMMCSCICCVAKLVDCEMGDRVSVTDLCVTSDRRLRFHYRYTGPHQLKVIRFFFTPLGTSASAALVVPGLHDLKTVEAVPPDSRISEYALTFSDDILKPGGNEASCFEKFLITPEACPSDSEK